MPEKDQTLNISVAPKAASATKIFQKNRKITLPIFLKFAALLIMSMFGAAIFGSSIGNILNDPLFFFTFEMSVLIFFCIGFILFISGMFLIGIFFSDSYKLLLAATFILSLTLGLSTLLFSHIYILIGFTIGTFIVLIVFFIGMESDVTNQFTFKFFPSVKSSSSFSSWFSLCFTICYAISLVTIVGSPNYKVPDAFTDSVFHFVESSTNVDLNYANQSLSDIAKKGASIDIFKALSPSNDDLKLTPKQFISNKINELVKAHTFIIIGIIVLNSYFALRFFQSFLAFFAKFITLGIMQILKLTGFFVLERVQKEALVVSI